jgi:hypothetical protein
MIDRSHIQGIGSGCVCFLQMGLIFPPLPKVIEEEEPLRDGL